MLKHSSRTCFHTFRRFPFSFYSFRYSNIASLSWKKLCLKPLPPPLQHKFFYLSLFLAFYFLFSEPPSSHISLFLTEINPSLLVKSLIKLETLYRAWLSAQMVTVKTNNPCHHLSNLYLFLSHLSFSVFFLNTFFSFYIFIFSLSFFSITEL